MPKYDGIFGAFCSKPYPPHCLASFLGKLLTPLCFCHQAVLVSV